MTKEQQHSKDVEFSVSLDEEAVCYNIQELAEKEYLTIDECVYIAETIFIPFAELFTGYKLYNFQKEILIGVICSLFRVGEEVVNFSVLIARQSGKSTVVSIIVCVAGILLPALAKTLKCKSIQKYKKEFKVGIYGPDYDKAGIIFDNIISCFQSESAKQIISQDKSFGIRPEEIKRLKFSNGFSVSLRTANKQAKIEGHTYNLIITEETQDIDSTIIKKSLLPMRSSTGGPVISIGTPKPKICFFSELCKNNYNRDVADNNEKAPYRRHYEYDWTHKAAAEPIYKKTVEEDMINMGGEFSDEFRMAYKVEWLHDSGSLITQEQLDKCGIKKRRTDSTRILNPLTMQQTESEFTRPAGQVDSDINTPDQVFALDLAKIGDYTVLTTARVWWDNPIEFGENCRYHIHINGWLELNGDYELQYEEIIQKIRRYNMSMGIVDATGVGDPIHNRLQGELIREGIDVHPFKFTPKSKDIGYKILKQEILAKRVTFPDSNNIRRYKTHQKFKKELTTLVKEYTNSNYMKVSHPNISGFHDDYADSLMMLVYMVNTYGPAGIQVVPSDYMAGTSDRPFEPNTYVRQANRHLNKSRYRQSIRQPRWYNR